MNSRDFCIWFKGFLDVTRSAQLEVIQLDIVKKHLEDTLIQEGVIQPKAPVVTGGIATYDEKGRRVEDLTFYNMSNFHQGT